MDRNKRNVNKCAYTEWASEFEALRSSLTPRGAAASERLTATLQSILADNHYINTLAVSLYVESVRRALGYESDADRATDRLNVALRALGLTKCAAAGCTIAVKIAARNSAKNR